MRKSTVNQPMPSCNTRIWPSPKDGDFHYPESQNPLSPSFCPTPHSASRSNSEWKLAKDINKVEYIFVNYYKMECANCKQRIRLFWIRTSLNSNNTIYFVYHYNNFFIILCNHLGSAPASCTRIHLVRVEWSRGMKHHDYQALLFWPIVSRSQGSPFNTHWKNELDLG